MRILCLDSIAVHLSDTVYNRSVLYHPHYAVCYCVVTICASEKCVGVRTCLQQHLTSMGPIPSPVLVIHMELMTMCRSLLVLDVLRPLFLQF